MVYVSISFAITAIVRDLTVDLIALAGDATVQYASWLLAASIILLPLFLIVPFIIGRCRVVSNIRLAIYAILGSIFLQIGFAFLKSTFPMIVPFYADPSLANFDRWLHGGYEPWELAHWVGHYLPIDSLLPVYLWVWGTPAIALILIIAVTDRDDARTKRFVALYLACWLVLGNVIALAGSSVGPVYYDALLGGDRFAGLHAALANSDVANSAIGRIQHLLWNAYAETGGGVGLGISAFPSVHVGIAALTALYMAERSRWLLLPGLVFLAITLFLSVYTGYHYAVDGYFSILFMYGLWFALRRVTLTELTLPGLRATQNEMPVTTQ